MCEILVRAGDSFNRDLDKERRGCYKRGDPVVVMPDGHEWGSAECLPTFFVIKIPDLPVETAKKYIEPEWDTDNGSLMYRRRRYQIPIDNLPLTIKNKLLADGSITINLTQIRNYLIDKTTGLPG